MIDHDAVGSVIPAPPPPRGTAAAGHDYSGAIMQLWEQVLVAGGELPEAELRTYSDNNSAHEYLRHHPTATERDAQNHADSWYHRQLMDQAIERGWLIRDGSTLRLGSVPGENMPMEKDTQDPETRQLLLMARLLDRMMPDLTEQRAYDLLTQKSDPLRIAAGDKRAIRESLTNLGQLDPVICWRRLASDPEIVVDGRTRVDILEGEMGLAAERRWLNPKMTARMVVAYRIAHELARKNLTPEQRNAYIGKLHDLGIDQKAIGATVGLTRQRVGQVLAKVAKVKRRTLADMTDAERSEIIALHSAGWGQDDIAARMAWSRQSIGRVLLDAEQPSSETPGSEAKPLPQSGKAQKPPKPSTLKAGVIRAALTLGVWAEEADLRSMAIRAQHRDPQKSARLGGADLMKDLVADGWLQIEEGDPLQYLATNQAERYFTPLVEEPEPTVEPVAEPVEPRLREADRLDEWLAAGVAEFGLDAIIERALGLRRGAA